MNLTSRLKITLNIQSIKATIEFEKKEDPYFGNLMFNQKLFQSERFIEFVCHWKFLCSDCASLFQEILKTCSFYGKTYVYAVIWWNSVPKHNQIDMDHLQDKLSCLFQSFQRNSWYQHRHDMSGLMNANFCNLRWLLDKKLFWNLILS